MGFKTSASQDNEKGIGAVEVNQNPMLYSILENNGEAKATAQRSTPNFNLCLEGVGLQNVRNGGLNDNLQGVKNNQQIEGKVTNVDPSLTKNTITIRRMDLLGLPLKEPFTHLKNAPQNITIDFICMVIDIDESLTLSKALQSENKIQWEHVVQEEY